MGRFLTLVLILAVGATAQAEVFRFGLPATHEFKYELAVIRLALENAPGEHSLEIVQLPVVSSKRWLETLRQGHHGINVGLSGYDPMLDDTFLRVDIPLTRGLLGYRLLVVKQDRVSEFKGVDSLTELKPFKMGSGFNWQENPILRHHGLDLELGHYENLWAMLNRERFDVLHRGVQEVFDELETLDQTGFTILPDIALAFRFDYFLYVPSDRPDLHRILHQGLLNAYDNGAFMTLFEKDPVIQQTLQRAGFQQRKVIWLSTPENRSAIDTIPDTFWHQAVRLRDR